MNLWDICQRQHAGPPFAGTLAQVHIDIGVLGLQAHSRSPQYVTSNSLILHLRQLNMLQTQMRAAQSPPRARTDHQSIKPPKRPPESLESLGNPARSLYRPLRVHRTHLTLHTDHLVAHLSTLRACVGHLRAAQPPLEFTQDPIEAAVVGLAL